MSSVRTPRFFLALVLVLLVAAACGGDDDDTTTAGDSSTSTSTTTSTTSTTSSSSTTSAPADGDLPSACELAPANEINALTGLTLGEGADTGDERRSVCAFSAADSGGVGVTIGIEGGSRYDEKAARSEEIFGSPGLEIANLGDQARFWFTTDEFPEGLSGVLVGSGDLTADVSIQGIADEGAAQDAAVEIAVLVAEGL